MSDAPATALLVIDLQRQFAEGGRLGVTGSGSIMANVHRLVAAARSGGVPVVWTAFRVPSPRVLGRTSRRLGVTDLHVGADADLLPDLPVAPEDLIVDKPRQSAFLGTALDQHLRALGVGSLVICGLTTNSCVLATAIDAAARDLDVAVVSDATWAMPIPATDGAAAMPADAVVAAALAFVRWSLGRTVTTEVAVPMLAGIGAGAPPTP